MINIYDEKDNILGRVKYSTNLDSYDGSNYCSGHTGRHQGLTKLKNGNYVLIHISEWQYENNHAEIISAEQALQEVLHCGDMSLLEEKRFSELKKLYNDMLTSEFSEVE